MSAVVIAVRLTPRGGANRIDGWGEDDQGRPVLKARVSVPPVDGEANAALEKLLARALGLSRSSVAITGGQTARVKQVRLDGVTLDEVRARLSPP
ncbi:MAG: DUF167 domain-containing protein [Caulobacter sp.]|nr:DUF167 domain-containing protein [Caulobacter sp.]